MVTPLGIKWRVGRKLRGVTDAYPAPTLPASRAGLTTPLGGAVAASGARTQHTPATLMQVAFLASVCRLD
jgi:hypothetical protein